MSPGAVFWTVMGIWSVLVLAALTYAAFSPIPQDDDEEEGPQ